MSQFIGDGRRSVRVALVMAGIWAALLCPKAADAMIFTASQDPSYNTTAPTGAYANSGWRAVGEWGPGGGTAISPYHVLTAKHFTPGGDTFTLNGQSVTVTSMTDDVTDLRILTLAEPVGTWTNLYTGSNEVSKESVVIGRGRPAGGAVYEGGELKGWEWAATDGIKRWGTNIVDGTWNSGGLLGMDFDENGTAHEATFSQWDSGGGQFIKDTDGEWKLAGVVFAVNGPYDVDSDHENGNEFSAALFDEGGFYEKTSLTSWSYRVDKGFNQPQEMYSTRVSSRISWINSIISGAEPLAGDTDFDGDVDFNDAWALLGAYKAEGDWTWFNGDFNHDGVVDEADADILLANYGTGVAGGLDSTSIESALASMDGVPEPTTLALLAIGGCALLRRRR